MPLITDGLPYTGFIRDRDILYWLLVPEMAQNYAEGISKITGLPVETVIKSRPFVNYYRRVRGIKI